MERRVRAAVAEQEEGMSDLLVCLGQVDGCLYTVVRSDEFI